MGRRESRRERHKARGVLRRRVDRLRRFLAKIFNDPDHSDAERRELATGDFLLVPRGEWHGLANPGPERARFLVVLSPPGFEGYWAETAERLAARGVYEPPDTGGRNANFYPSLANPNPPAGGTLAGFVVSLSSRMDEFEMALSLSGTLGRRNGVSSRTTTHSTPC